MKNFLLILFFIILIIPAFFNEEYSVTIFVIFVMGVLVYIANFIYSKIPVNVQEWDIAFRNKIKNKIKLFFQRKRKEAKEKE